MPVAEISEVERLREDLRLSDELRAALADAVRDSASIAARALAQLERAQPVVDAARVLVDSYGWEVDYAGPLLRSLAHAVAAYRAGGPQ